MGLLRTGFLQIDEFLEILDRLKDFQIQWTSQRYFKYKRPAKGPLCVIDLSKGILDVEGVSPKSRPS